MSQILKHHQATESALEDLRYWEDRLNQGWPWSEDAGLDQPSFLPLTSPSPLDPL